MRLDLAAAAMDFPSAGADERAVQLPSLPQTPLVLAVPKAPLGLSRRSRSLVAAHLEQIRLFFAALAVDPDLSAARRKAPAEAALPFPFDHLLQPPISIPDDLSTDNVPLLSLANILHIRDPHAQLRAVRAAYANMRIAHMSELVAVHEQQPSLAPFTPLTTPPLQITLSRNNQKSIKMSLHAHLPNHPDLHLFTQNNAIDVSDMHSIPTATASACLRNPWFSWFILTPANKFQEDYNATWALLSDAIYASSGFKLVPPDQPEYNWESALESKSAPTALIVPAVHIKSSIPIEKALNELLYHNAHTWILLIGSPSIKKGFKPPGNWSLDPPKTPLSCEPDYVLSLPSRQTSHVKIAVSEPVVEQAHQQSARSVPQQPVAPPTTSSALVTQSTSQDGLTADQYFTWISTTEIENIRDIGYCIMAKIDKTIQVGYENLIPRLQSIGERLATLFSTIQQDQENLKLFRSTAPNLPDLKAFQTSIDINRAKYESIFPKFNNVRSIVRNMHTQSGEIKARIGPHQAVVAKMEPFATEANISGICNAIMTYLQSNNVAQDMSPRVAMMREFMSILTSEVTITNTFRSLFSDIESIEQELGTTNTMHAQSRNMIQHDPLHMSSSSSSSSSDARVPNIPSAHASYGHAYQQQPMPTSSSMPSNSESIQDIDLTMSRIFAMQDTTEQPIINRSRDPRRQI